MQLIGISAFKLEKVLEMDPAFLDTEAEHEHDPRVSSISTRFEGFLNVKKLKLWSTPPAATPRPSHPAGHVGYVLRSGSHRPHKGPPAR